MNAPAFSLIVATLNRPPELSRLVETLAKQDAGRVQLVVVDQSDDEAAVANAEMLAGYSDRLTIQHLRQAGRGLSRARNLGLEHVIGEVVCFPDDDCWYPEDILARVRDWFAAHAEYDFVSGRFTDEEGRPNWRYRPDPMPMSTWTTFGRARSVGLFFRRHALAGQRFDERLGAGADMPVGEEIDLVLSVLRAGWRGYYEPSLAVYHPLSTGLPSDPSVLRQLETAYGYVLAKHGFAGSGAVAARLALGLLKAAGRSAWSVGARASLFGRCRGIANYLGAQTR